MGCYAVCWHGVCSGQRSRSRASLCRGQGVAATDAGLPRHPAPTLAGSRQQLLRLLTTRRCMLPAALLLLLMLLGVE